MSTGAGERFVLVAPAAGTREPAFDHARLAAALAAASGHWAWWAPTARRCTTSASGALLGQVTSGPWAVRQILHVDEAERTVYFTASGPDGSAFAKVTDDDLDHVVTVSENKEYFIDSASTVDTRR